MSVYSALPSASSIRLVKLDAWSTKHTRSISFTLHTTELSQAPEYHALSYTWGDPANPALDLLEPLPSPPITVECNRQSFMVGPNLAAALQHLVSLFDSSPGAYVWIDAICINQDDLEERASQVKLMGLIYSRAQTVYAWLGPKDASSDDVLEIIEQFSSVPSEMLQIREHFNFLYPDTYAARMGIRPIPVDKLFAWGALALRSYFQRVWILQEVVKAARVIFVLGDSHFLFEQLEKAVLFFEARHWLEFFHPAKLNMVMKSDSTLRGQIPPLYTGTISLASNPNGGGFIDGLQQLVQMRRRLGAREEGPDRIQFASLVVLQRWRRATDPRDIIFALIPVLSGSPFPYKDLSELLSTVDYGVSVEHLYTEFAWKFIQQSASLLLWKQKEDESNTELRSLPSWVPDWSVNLKHRTLPHFDKCSWMASQNIPVSFQKKDHLLGLQGICIGKITQTSTLPDVPHVHSTARFQSFADIISKMPVMCVVKPRKISGLDPASPQTLSRLQLFAITFMLDESDGEIPAPLDVGYAVLAFIFRQLSRAWRDRASLAAEGVIDFDPFAKEDPPSASKISRLFRFGRAESTVPPEFSNPLTKPWLELVRSESDRGGLELSKLKRALEWASLDTPKSWIVGVTERFAISFTCKKLFRTDTGALGISPQSAREGDEVWILGGGTTPYVLRRLGSGHHKLLGEAYVSGAMYGQAITEPHSCQTVWVE